MFIERNENQGVIVLGSVAATEYSQIIWATQPETETAEPIAETAKTTQGKLVSHWVIEDDKLVCQWLIED